MPDSSPSPSVSSPPAGAATSPAAAPDALLARIAELERRLELTQIQINPEERALFETAQSYARTVDGLTDQRAIDDFALQTVRTARGSSTVVPETGRLAAHEYHYRILEPVVRDNLEAHGVPAEELDERVQARMDAFGDLATMSRNRAHRIHDYFAGREERARELSASISEYGAVVGWNEERIQSWIRSETPMVDHQDHETWRTNSNNADNNGIWNGQNRSHSWARATVRAAQYRETFNHHYAEAGLDEEQIQAEWERQAGVEGSTVNNIVRGNLTGDQIWTARNALENTPVAHIRAEMELREAQNELQTLTEQLERDTATATGPDIPGTAVLRDQDGNIVQRDEEGVVRDADNNQVAAGTIVTATMGTGSNRVQQRFEVQDAGTLGAATVAPAATPGAGPAAAPGAAR